MLAVTQSEAAPLVAPTGVKPLAPTGGSTIAQASNPPLAAPPIRKDGTVLSIMGGTRAGTVTTRDRAISSISSIGFDTTPALPYAQLVTSAWGVTLSQVNSDPVLQQKLDQVEALAKKTYEDANAVAKAAAADKLNKELKLDPPLTGHEDWKTVCAVVAAAAGAAAGGALCGPICAKVGALCGAYLGAKLGDLLAKNYDDLKDWLEGKWSTLKGYAEDVADAAEDAYDYVSGLNPF